MHVGHKVIQQQITLVTISSIFANIFHISLHITNLCLISVLKKKWGLQFYTILSEIV